MKTTLVRKHMSFLRHVRHRQWQGPRYLNLASRRYEQVSSVSVGVDQGSHRFAWRSQGPLHRSFTHDQSQPFLSCSSQPTYSRGLPFK